MNVTKKLFKMRIAFVVLGNSRRSNYLDGDTIRYGNGGGSGTDGSTILIAEYLASQGHDVVLASEKLEPQLEIKYAAEGKPFNPGRVVRGVTYTDFDFEGVDNKEFDILVSMLWFHDYHKLPIKVTKSVIYWSHMQWIYGIEELIKYASDNDLSLGFVNISEWEKEMNKGVVEHTINRYPKTKSYLIPNPVMDEMINEVLATNPVKKPHKFVHHAAWARGGSVAVEVVNALGYEDSELHSFDYLLATHPHTESFFRPHLGVDKKTLFTHIAESEYFLYPLYTPYKDVHKDTFSCVVAEAIALGAIPVTYPLGALPENFDTYCAWVDFPEGADPEQMNRESLSKDEVGIFKNNVPNIVKTVQYLEENPDIKEDIRERGREYILNTFNVTKIGNMWVDFINQLV